MSPRTRAALLGDGSPAARSLATGCVVLVVVMEAKFRNRSAAAALEGSVDVQVGVELAVATVAGAWLVARRLRRERRDVTSARADARSPMAWLRAIVVAAVVSSFWSPTAIASVRAIEFCILVELCVEAISVIRLTPAALIAFFDRLVTGMVTAVAGLLVLTVVLPTYDLFQHDYSGVPRLHLAAMHPIASANLMGATAVVVAGWAFASSPSGYAPGPDRVTVRGWRDPGRRLWVVALVLALVAGVILTRERGSIAATLVALASLVVRVRRTPRFRLGALAAAIAGCVLLLTVGGAVIRSLVLRGQTASALASVSGRTEIWAIAFHYFAANPVFGAGYLAGRSIYFSSISYGGRSHNAFVEVAVSLGIVGLTLYAGLLWTCCRRVGRAVESMSPARIRLAWFGVGLLVFSVLVGLVDDSFAGSPGLMTFVLALAVALVELSSTSAADVGDAVRPARRPAEMSLR